jgi:hypothetical protein
MLHKDWRDRWRGDLRRSFTLDDREPAYVRSRAIELADKWIREDKRHDVRMPLRNYKDKDKLVASFGRRLASGSALKALISCKQASLESISNALADVVLTYDDDDVAGEPDWPAYDLPTDETERRIDHLDKAIKHLRAAQFDDVAEDLEPRSKQAKFAIQARRNREAEWHHPAKAGKRMTRIGVLAEDLNESLDPVSTPLRWELIAQIVSDFYEQKTPEQIRLLLKDTIRRRAR